jgi:hypothetical protein
LLPLFSALCRHSVELDNSNYNPLLGKRGSNDATGLVLHSRFVTRLNSSHPLGAQSPPFQGGSPISGSAKDPETRMSLSEPQAYVPEAISLTSRPRFSRIWGEVAE